MSQNPFPQLNLETAVLRTLSGAFISREAWKEEQGGEPVPLDEVRWHLDNLVELEASLGDAG